MIVASRHQLNKVIKSICFLLVSVAFSVSTQELILSHHYIENSAENGNYGRMMIRETAHKINFLFDSSLEELRASRKRAASVNPMLSYQINNNRLVNLSTLTNPYFCNIYIYQ